MKIYQSKGTVKVHIIYTELNNRAYFLNEYYIVIYNIIYLTKSYIFNFTRLYIQVFTYKGPTIHKHYFYFIRKFFINIVVVRYFYPDYYPDSFSYNILY